MAQLENVTLLEFAVRVKRMNPREGTAANADVRMKTNFETLIIRASSVKI